eukprot:354470-Chlamydomonas_euryale.AAC.45
MTVYGMLLLPCALAQTRGGSAQYTTAHEVDPGVLDGGPLGHWLVAGRVLKCLLCCLQHHVYILLTKEFSHLMGDHGRLDRPSEIFSYKRNVTTGPVIAYDACAECGSVRSDILGPFRSSRQACPMGRGWIPGAKCTLSAKGYTPCGLRSGEMLNDVLASAATGKLLFYGAVTKCQVGFMIGMGIQWPGAHPSIYKKHLKHPVVHAFHSKACTQVGLNQSAATGSS